MCVFLFLFFLIVGLLKFRIVGSVGFGMLCLCLTIHIATALHLFSACTLDVTSTVMTRVHVRSSMRTHSPLSGSSNVYESCAQDTEQKHGKHVGVGLLIFDIGLL